MDKRKHVSASAIRLENVTSICLAIPSAKTEGIGILEDETSIAFLQKTPS